MLSRRSIYQQIAFFQNSLCCLAIHCNLLFPRISGAADLKGYFTVLSRPDLHLTILQQCGFHADLHGSTFQDCLCSGGNELVDTYHIFFLCVDVLSKRR